MWKRQLRHRNVKSVENISRRNTCKKSTYFFFGSFLEISRFQTFFLQNPKLKWMVTCISNHSLDLYLSKSLGPLQNTTRILLKFTICDLFMYVWTKKNISPRLSLIRILLHLKWQIRVFWQSSGANKNLDYNHEKLSATKEVT